MRAGLIMAVGAVAYAVAVGGLDVSFDVTPLAVGGTVAIAGLAGRVERLVPIGLAVAGFGVAVLAARHGWVPAGRSAPAYLIGAAAGLLAANGYSRRYKLSLTGALVAVLVAGLAYYLAYEQAEVGRWRAWAAVLGAWGALEAVRDGRSLVGGRGARG